MTDTLGDRIYEVLDSGVIVPYVERRMPDWAPEAKECHRNVDDWVLRNPGSKAVRGWLFFNLRPRFQGVLFTAHSLLEENSKLFDITPRTVTRQYPFIRHPGTEAEFADFVNSERGSFFYTTPVIEDY